MEDASMELHLVWASRPNLHTKFITPIGAGVGPLSVKGYR